MDGGITKRQLTHLFVACLKYRQHHNHYITLKHSLHNIASLKIHQHNNNSVTIKKILLWQIHIHMGALLMTGRFIQWDIKYVSEMNNYIKLSVLLAKPFVSQHFHIFLHFKQGLLCIHRYYSLIQKKMIWNIRITFVCDFLTYYSK